MRRSMTLAAICGDIIGSTLDRCNIKTGDSGFTTKHWKGRARNCGLAKEVTLILDD